jgi:hypothetical protein
MPTGLPGRLSRRKGATSPAWVPRRLQLGGNGLVLPPHPGGCGDHRGIGLWLLLAVRGWSARLAGLSAVAWGLVVWVFGEAFGGVFAPGLSVLFGAPGAVLIYAVVGTLLALPERSWRSATLGKFLLSGLGVFFAGMAVLQAWPGRGFWQGASHGTPGSLVAMVSSMSATPQPAPLARLIAGFASFAAGHGSLVNAVTVITLAAIGVGLIGGGMRAIGGSGAEAPGPRPASTAAGYGVGGSRWHRLLLATVMLATVACLAVWILVQDLGFLGGLGTDPNSMIPLLLLVFTGYLGVTRVPQPAEHEVAQVTVPAPAPAPGPVPTPAPAPALSRATGGGQRSWPASIRPSGLARGFASARASGLVALWGAFLVLFGAGPIAMAQANPVADPIIARAIGGSTAPLYLPAARQHGRPVASLRGKVVAPSPGLLHDCPVIAQEVRIADQMKTQGIWR